MNTTDKSLDRNYAPDMEPQKGRWLLTLEHILLILSLIVILLRFWSRATLSSRRRFQADDWTALAALPFILGVPIVALYMLRHGLGHHVTEVPIGNLEASLKALLVGILCFYLGMTLIRVSATLFYRRTLVTHGLLFTRCLWANVALNILFVIAIIPVIVTTCDPVNAFWDRTLPGYKCRSGAQLMNSAGVVAAILDVITLILPLPIITRLKLSWQKKLLVCGIFVLGYSVVVFSIGRAVTMYKLGASLDKDITWSLVSAKYWIDLEVAVAYTGISLPAIFALCRRAKSHGLASLFNNRVYQKPPSSIDASRQISYLSTATETTYVGKSDVQGDTDVENGKIMSTRSWSVVVREAECPQ